MQQLDGPEILPQARTALLHHGERAGLAVVLLHGFTNHPGQYREFAPLVRDRGANVLVPRLPKHGDRDRLSSRIAALTAEMLLDRTAEAVGIACGLGERVCVAGISSSGLLSAYFAQHHAEVTRAVAVAPEFAILDLSYPLSRAAAAAMRFAPNAFLWWNPRAKNQMHPLTAYPRFSTRALGQTLRLADDVYRAARREPHAARAIHTIVNANDPAVNNLVTERVVRRWNAKRPGATLFAFDNLPKNHDIIEPDNPNARTDIVYPVLLERILNEG